MTYDNDLFSYARRLDSREDFTKFIELLVEDYKARHDEWSNNNLESFLDGLSGFVRDMDGYYKNIGESVDTEVVSWRIVAEMLLAATVYE